jgi:hypothetical protein
MALSRHFVPGYDQPVPPGQKPFAHRNASHYLSAYGLKPWAEFSSPFGFGAKISDATFCKCPNCRAACGCHWFPNRPPSPVVGTGPFFLAVPLPSIAALNLRKSASRLPGTGHCCLNIDNQFFQTSPLSAQAFSWLLSFASLLFLGFVLTRSQGEAPPHGRFSFPQTMV